jgi:hypothetical protein
MANLLNMSSVMMCPHGGTVSAVSQNTQVMVAGGLMLRASDTFLIAGCVFALGPTPHPCVQVKWVKPNSKSQVNNDFTISQESMGLCLAADMAVQGTVLVNFTQAQGSGL